MNIKAKYEILCAGLFFREEITIGNFKYKIQPIDKRKRIIESDIIYCNPLLAYCLFPTNDKQVSFAYFEYEKNFELDIEIEKFKELEEHEQVKIIDKQDLYEDIFNFEKELCLKTNNCIKFPVIKAEFYYENNQKITCMLEYSKLNIPPFLSCDRERIKDKLEKQKRLAYALSPETIKNAQKKFVRFNRALKFYHSAMSINDSATAFILLMSAIESLFNIKNGTKCPTCEIIRYDVTKTVSEYVGKILNDTDGSIISRFKRLYTLRSNYIHGIKDIDITYEDEVELREFVRKIILIYSFIIHLNPTFNEDKNVINVIDSGNLYDEKMLLFIELFVKDI